MLSIDENAHWIENFLSCTTRFYYSIFEKTRLTLGMLIGYFAPVKQRHRLPMNFFSLLIPASYLLIDTVDS